MNKHRKSDASPASEELLTKVEHDAVGALGGAAAGTALGMIAGPPGMVAGAVVGGIVGAVATALVERDNNLAEAVEEADEEESARLTARTPPHRISGAIGAFSAASAGVSTGSAVPDAEGPISPPED
jgi:hypothetical protein